MCSSDLVCFIYAFKDIIVLEFSFIVSFIVLLGSLTYICLFFMHTESFSKQIGSKYGILSGSRDNSLYNALWVAQALLRKGYALMQNNSNHFYDIVCITYTVSSNVGDGIMSGLQKQLIKEFCYLQMKMILLGISRE